jgi:thioredoxin-dependent peroxiredoxin
MSKKTRKKTREKSPQTSARKTAPAKSSRAPTTKKRTATVTTSASKTGKPSGAAAAKASHRSASKPLKSPRPKTAAKPSAAADSRHALSEGAKAPAFRLPRDGGETVSLADFAGQKLVVFFYPRADTPGCTREAIDFTRLAKAFADNGTTVLGVSADSLKAQEAFRNKHRLEIPLVSDETHEMLDAYGAWGEKSMYGKTFLGIIRTTVLIGADGRVARVWRRVKVDGHADEVLAAAQAV